MPAVGPRGVRMWRRVLPQGALRWLSARRRPGRSRCRVTSWCVPRLRRATQARPQAEMPFTAELCGTCLQAVWREAPAEIAVTRLLPARLSERAAQHAEDALLLRLFRSGVRVPSLTGLVPV